MEEVLKSLYTSVRGAAAGSSVAFDGAAAQLQLFGAAAMRQAGAADLAEELLERAEQLAGSKQASQRLLGLQLLRTAIVHCQRRTFLTQHVQWAALLLATLRSEQQLSTKQQQQPSAVAAEACACLAAYFERVGRMLEVPGVRRDGAAAAAKLAAQLLQQGRQDKQQQQQQQVAAAPSLLSLPQGQTALLAALTALPASFRQHLKALEAHLLPLLMHPAPGCGGSSGSALLAACAAALPRITGDGSSWSAFCQRLLVTAHRLADVLLLQQDDASLAAAARAALDPSAEPLPLLPTGGGSGALSSDAYAAGFGQLGAVLQVLQQLLTASYPSAVPVPASGLLMLASRLLSVDDSMGSSGGKAATAAAASARFPQLCMQLPAVQGAALGMLHSMLATCGSAAAPYFVATARLLSELLQRSAAGGGAVGLSSEVCCRLFGASRQLLQSAGVGAVRTLAPMLLHASAVEMYGRRPPAGAGMGAEEGPVKKKARKGKQAAGLDGDAAAGAPCDDLGAAVQQRDMAVQASALHALQALCASGSPLLAQQQRRQVDDMAAHVAATSTAAACHLSSDAESAVGASLAALQLASYELLLSTLLAPAPYRPPHLAPALQLFRNGACGGPAGAATLAPFCRQALLSLEALLHPRTMPPPAPARRVLTAAEAEDADGASTPLGMPRFWSSVDAVLLLQHEQVQLAARLAAQPAETGRASKDGGGDEEMGEAEAEEQAFGQGQQQQQQPAAPAWAPLQAQPAQAAPPAAPAPAMAFNAPPAAPPAQQQAQQQALSSMAALLSAPAAAAAALPAGAAPSAQLPSPGSLVAPPAAALAAPAAFVPAPIVAAPAAAAAATVLAAAEEESDSEGSLPEIDSGEGSSSSESEGESDKEEEASG